MIRIKHSCAVRDKTFSITYDCIDGRYKPVPEPPKLSLRESLKAIAAGRDAAVEKKTQINAAELDQPPCPLCGNAAWIICGQCNTHVCGGLSQPGRFACRRSCGAIGTTRPALACDVIDRGDRASIAGPKREAISGPIRRIK